MNRQDFVKDQSAKSLSFYCTREVVWIDDTMIDQLVETSEANGQVNVRICLHDSPYDSFHEMLILERKGHSFGPHKHLDKGESWHFIRGEIAVFIFDDEGRVTDRLIIGADHHLVGRIGVAQWHMVVPLTELAIYHESKPGPYLGNSDSVFPDWGPGRDDDAAVREYVDKLLESFDKGMWS